MTFSIRSSLLSGLTVIAAVAMIAIPAFAGSHCACKHDDKTPACHCKTPCACNQDHTQPANKPYHCK